MYNVFSGTFPSRYNNHSLKYFENLEKEIEARRTKAAMTSFRKNLLDQQNQMNYTNEVNRI